MNELGQKKCVPCEGGTAPLNAQQASLYLRQLDGNWKITDDTKTLSRSFAYADFKSALAFVSSVATIAEEEGHHPDIEFGWGYANIKLATHAINGLSENDFIMAAKIDEMI